MDSFVEGLNTKNLPPSGSQKRLKTRSIPVASVAWIANCHIFPPSSKSVQNPFLVEFRSTWIGTDVLIKAFGFLFLTESSWKILFMSGVFRLIIAPPFTALLVISSKFFEELTGISPVLICEKHIFTLNTEMIKNRIKRTFIIFNWLYGKQNNNHFYNSNAAHYLREECNY